MLLAFEDGLRHVHLQNHQRDKSVRADYLADEVMFRFSSKTLGAQDALGLFKEAEGLAIQIDKIHQNLERAIKTAPAFPEYATHPQRFLDASSFMLGQTRGFLGMENSVKSGAAQVRNLLYPEPPKNQTSAMQRFFAANLNQEAERERERIKALSDATLSVKVLQMTRENELAKPGSMVYGTATLKVYLPMMLTGLLEGVSSESARATLQEYVGSASQLVSHLQRCQRQVDLLTDSSPQP